MTSQHTRLTPGDGESEGEEGKAVLEECLRGASAEGGHVVVITTPQAGFAWMTEELAQGSKHAATRGKE